MTQQGKGQGRVGGGGSLGTAVWGVGRMVWPPPAFQITCISGLT